MRQDQRKNFLHVIAKKQNSKLEGVFTKKTLMKALEGCKKEYFESCEKYDQAEKEIESLSKLIEEMEEIRDQKKKEIELCHEVMKNMDFSNVEKVKINGEDVSYIHKNKSYDIDDKEKSLIPKKKKKNEDENNAFVKEDEMDGTEDLGLDEGIQVTY